MSQQYKRVSMEEVTTVLDAMDPRKGYTSDYLANVTGMPWRRVTYALVRAEKKGLVEVIRPSPQAKQKGDRNIYWRVVEE